MMQSCLVIGGMKGSNSSIASSGGLPHRSRIFQLITPSEYLRIQPTQQVAEPECIKLGRRRILAGLAE